MRGDSPQWGFNRKKPPAKVLNVHSACQEGSLNFIGGGARVGVWLGQVAMQIEGLLRFHSCRWLLGCQAGNPYSHLHPKQIRWKSSGSGNACDLLSRWGFFSGSLVSHLEEEERGARRTPSSALSWLVELRTAPGAGRRAGSTMAHTVPVLKSHDRPNSLPLPHHHILSHGSECFCLCFSFPPFGWKIIRF